jgi:hypothetical protein
MLRSVHCIIDALTLENIYDALIDFPIDNFPIPLHILSSNTFTPYFNGCIGTLDGTHLSVYIPKVGYTCFLQSKRGSLTKCPSCMYNEHTIPLCVSWLGG